MSFLKRPRYLLALLSDTAEHAIKNDLPRPSCSSEESDPENI